MMDREGFWVPGMWVMHYKHGKPVDVGKVLKVYKDGGPQVQLDSRPAKPVRFVHSGRPWGSSNYASGGFLRPLSDCPGKPEDEHQAREIVKEAQEAREAENTLQGAKNAKRKELTNAMLREAHGDALADSKEVKTHIGTLHIIESVDRFGEPKVALVSMGKRYWMGHESWHAWIGSMGTTNGEGFGSYGSVSGDTEDEAWLEVLGAVFGLQQEQQEQIKEAVSQVQA